MLPFAVSTVTLRNFAEIRNKHALFWHAAAAIVRARGRVWRKTRNCLCFSVRRDKPAWRRR